MERTAAGLCRQGYEEDHENIGQDFRGCSGRDLNRRVSEYPPETLPNEALYSVTNCEWLSKRKVSVVICSWELSPSFFRERD